MIGITFGQERRMATQGAQFRKKPMAGRCEGFYFFCDEYVGFEVFWQQEGWFWRPLLTLDGEAVGPFTKSTEAYQTACRLLKETHRPVA